MTTEEAAALGPSTVAILPVAAIEQHGPHLPLGTDAAILDGVLDAALALGPFDGLALRLPTQRIGCSPEHESFPGTLSLPPELLLDAWTRIGRSVARAGCAKLILLNAHGGQSSIVDLAAMRLRREVGMLAIRCDVFRLGLPPRALTRAERDFGWHGGMVETSLMLALAPDSVRRERIADFSSAAAPVDDDAVLGAPESGARFAWMAEDLNPAGAVGDATVASEGFGRALLALWSEKLARLIGEAQRLEGWPRPTPGP